MSLEPATIRLVRETLEERLDRREAAALLFEALADWGPRVPAERVELTQVVQGPLRVALLRRLPAAEAYALLRRVEQALITAEAPTGKHASLSHADADAWFAEEERSTDELPLVHGVARVLVLSATDELAINLGVCLGGFSVQMMNAGSLRELSKMTGDPDFVVVDCKLPTAIDDRVVVNLLRNLGPSVLCIVWGVDLPVGEALVRELEGARLHVIPIALASGVAPVLDLLASRAPPRGAR